MNNHTETLTLNNGRQLEFLTQGTSDGLAVVYLHGTPGALHDHSQHAELYRELGLRMISVNRPGTGASTYQEGWNALSFAEDLKQLLDALGVKRVTMIGFSAGGLHACAFAQRYPERVTRLGLLGSVGPFDNPALGDKRSEATKMFHDTARDNPGALMGQLAAITLPEALVALLHSLVIPGDQAILARPEIDSQLRLSFSDVLVQGLEPLITEIAIINSPWGFPVSEVTVETHIWHGTADINIPVECSEYLEREIPGARANYLEGAGHYFSFAQWPELLRKIVAD